MNRFVLLAALCWPSLLFSQAPCVSMASIGAPCAPAQFQFFACTQNATGAQWSFPGSSSPSQNGLYVNTVFPTAGTYTATVTIDVPGGTVDTSFSIVVSDAPDICLVPTTPGGCTGQTVCFDATCTSGTALSFDWSLGDGASSSLQNFCHDFTDSGCHEISLTVTDSFGCVAETLWTDLACVNPSLVACIESLSPPCGCSAPHTVQLMSCSTVGADVTYQWITHGGFAALPDEPLTAVTYSDFGSYDVSLVVTNASNCSDTVTLNDFICVNNFTPTLFILNTTFPVGDTITFQSGPATSFAWTIDPASVDTIDNDALLHVVFNQSGSYNVCLNATFNGCAAQLCTTVVVVDAIGIERILNNFNNAVWYNSTTDELVTALDTDASQTLVLFDITGRAILERALVSGRNAIDVRHLPTGIYAYWIFNDVGMSMRGVVAIP